MTVAIIGGSGFARIDGFQQSGLLQIETPYGAPSSGLTIGTLGGVEICHLARHGPEHSIPPHTINYRANIWALNKHGVSCVIALNAVGGIVASSPAGTLVIPDQIIDYTYGRAHTYFDGSDSVVSHAEMTDPYDEDLRKSIIEAAAIAGLAVVTQGTYAATQGPRFETAAEIKRLAADGATVVGMTGMPEAGLARELGIAYAALCLVVNAAAGVNKGGISAQEIEQSMESGRRQIATLLTELVPRLKGERFSPPPSFTP